MTEKNATSTLRKPPNKTVRASAQPKYLTLADILREQIETKQLKIGEQLPTFTEMRDSHGVTSGTIERTYNFLEQSGLIERRPGRGVFVARPRRELCGTIGFIGSSAYKLAKMPFYAHLMEGIQNAAAARGQEILFLGDESSWRVEACSKIDGLICSVVDPEVVIRELPADLPRVCVLGLAEGVASVGVDNTRAALVGTRHLLELGHRRIGCVMEESFPDSRRRYAGYCEALQEAGIALDSRLVRRSDATAFTNGAQPYRAWAQKQIREWLRNDWYESGCTAILAQNEMAAIGVMQTLKEEGINVPQDVSVMGIDGTELCELVTPRLTVVALPLEQIGMRAMDVLNRQIAGEDVAAESIMLPVSMQAGESVAAPAAIAR